MASNNHVMSVAAASKHSGISPALLYNWVKTEKIESRKDQTGTLQVSLDEIKKLHKPRRKSHKAPVVRKGVHRPRRRPATKQADFLMRLAKGMEVFFPDGIKPKQYLGAVQLMHAIQIVFS